MLSAPLANSMRPSAARTTSDMRLRSEVNSLTLRTSNLTTGTRPPRTPARPSCPSFWPIPPSHTRRVRLRGMRLHTCAPLQSSQVAMCAWDLWQLWQASSQGRRERGPCVIIRTRSPHPELHDAPCTACGGLLKVCCTLHNACCSCIVALLHVVRHHR